MSSTPTPALELRAVSGGYGRYDAIEEVSLTVGAGEAVAIVGANGAGKSTTLKAIMGLLRLSRGEIRVGGVTISGWPTHRIARGHVSYVPEGRRLFLDQTVEANLLLGAYHLRRDQEGVRRLLDETYDLFPRLVEYRDRLADRLSGGEQQMVAIERALMADPTVMLLDEPSLGLAPLALADVFGRLEDLRKRGRSLLIVEQHVKETLRLVDRVYVLDRGRITLSGSSSEVAESSGLVAAYLGEAELLGGSSDLTKQFEVDTHERSNA